MNKTVTVNISGVVFYLDEAAYAKLQAYLDAVKNHFTAKSYGQEVISDIEGRIAEQFMTKTQSNAQRVIAEADVDSLISKLGKVEDFADDNENIKDEPQPKHAKRLYRNGDDVMVGGVASGIATYLGLEPTLVRILFLITIFLGGYGILLYIILWVVVPEATTPAEKLEMKGAPVTLAQLEQSIKKNINDSKAGEKLKSTGSTAGHILRQLIQLVLRICQAILNVLLAVAGTVLTVGATVAAFILTITFTVLLFNPDSKHVDFPLTEVFSGGLYSLFTTSGYLVALVPLVLLSFLGISMTRKRNSFNNVAVITLVIIWFAAASTLASIGTKNAERIEEAWNAPAENVETREFQAANFDKISADGIANYKLIQGDTFKVTVNGAREELDKISFDVEEGELELEQKDTWEFICIFCRRHRLNVEVTAPIFNQIEVTGASHIQSDKLTNEGVKIDASGASELELNLTSKITSVELSGASRMNIIGSSDELTADISGASRLSADQFIVKKALVDASGASRVFVNVTEELTADASGASRIRYNGNPKTRFDESGSSEIEGKFKEINERQIQFPD